jgi:hypothetical protein
MPDPRRNKDDLFTITRRDLILGILLGLLICLILYVVLSLIPGPPPASPGDNQAVPSLQMA